ncbi:Early nodulin-like protein 2 [Rhynchospora pubera]|uniref:Early nodulin-like protein 2 n=1 Tax=Rhynchospora pubera TaxID=906938 RepID=A0AAV8DFE1_9POAL|nr:Early nodulin-like protein 2 [Rhynchospora pubera]KAJ4793862.1 Early nodulin-like protein 2 [Rhynchospora pubera]KAJ4793865.1 Early nodulin-like protein 2 [Rhynchospora pubera]KAJ4793868.1 Early nodulin-like protein 2 [Rhynchospora pubera]
MQRKTVNLAIAVFLVNLVGNIVPCIAIKAVSRNHVVGGDQGWDTSTDVASWSANKRFHVGDIIWFTYAAPQEGVIELKTKREFDSCETINPIKMYTEGLNHLMLDNEGSRYFTSTNPENCKKGLKLHVKVLPSIQQAQQIADSASYGVEEAVAEGPSISHARFYKGWLSLVWFVLAFVILV